MSIHGHPKRLLAALLLAGTSWIIDASPSSPLRGGSSSGAAATAAASSPVSAAAAPTGVFGHPSPSKTYPTYTDFTLWLVEEFDAPLDLDADPIWTWSDGGLREGQVRFEKEAIKFQDGKMRIEASINDNTGPQPETCSHAEKEPVTPKTLRSGELRTRHNMFRYGRYEVRMRAPTVQAGNTTVNGNYISTMFAFRDGKFKHWREIDIEVTGDTQSSVTMNVLNAENTDAWRPDIQSSKKFDAKGQNVRADFHTYAFEWLPSGITWYFDGEKVGEHLPADVLPIPELSTKIMMNLWIFNWLYGFGGREGKNNQYPMHNEYDWFRFYKWNFDSKYPCADGSTSCLTVDDMYLTSNNPCDGIPQTGTRNGWHPCTTTCKSR